MENVYHQSSPDYLYAHIKEGSKTLIFDEPFGRLGTSAIQKYLATEISLTKPQIFIFSSIPFAYDDFNGSNVRICTYMQDGNPSFINSVKALRDFQEKRLKKMVNEKVKISSEPEVIVVLDNYTDLFVSFDKEILQPMLVQFALRARETKMKLLINAKSADFHMSDNTLFTCCDVRLVINDHGLARAKYIDEKHTPTRYTSGDAIIVSSLQVGPRNVYI